MFLDAQYNTEASLGLEFYHGSEYSLLYNMYSIGDSYDFFPSSTFNP